MTHAPISPLLPVSVQIDIPKEVALVLLYSYLERDTDIKGTLALLDENWGACEELIVEVLEYLLGQVTFKPTAGAKPSFLTVSEDQQLRNAVDRYFASLAMPLPTCL